MPRRFSSQRRREALGPRCLRCGTTEDLTLDHVIARARGGKNDGNLQTLCGRCNTWKATRPHDYRVAGLPTKAGKARDDAAYRAGRKLWLATLEERRLTRTVYVSEAPDPPLDYEAQDSA